MKVLKYSPQALLSLLALWLLAIAFVVMLAADLWQRRVEARHA